MRLPSPFDLALIFDRRLYQPIPRPHDYPKSAAQIKSLRELKHNTLNLGVALQWLVSLPVLLGWFFEYSHSLNVAMVFAVCTLFIFWLLYRSFRVRDYLMWLDIALRLAQLKEELYTLEKMRD